MYTEKVIILPRRQLHVSAITKPLQRTIRDIVPISWVISGVKVSQAIAHAVHVEPLSIQHTEQGHAWLISSTSEAKIRIQGPYISISSGIHDNCPARRGDPADKHRLSSLLPSGYHDQSTVACSSGLDWG